MAGIRSDDVVFELGCGDGRFCVAAAKQGAARVVGYDVSSLLVAAARLRARLAGVADRARFEVQNIRTCDPGEATLVYLYLIRNHRSLGRRAVATPETGRTGTLSSFLIDTTKHSGFRLLTQEKTGLSYCLPLRARLELTTLMPPRVSVFHHAVSLRAQINDNVVTVAETGRSGEE